MSRLFFIFIIIPVVKSYNYNDDTMAPIILVHGIGRSQIEGKWHTHGHPKHCQEKSSWQTLWISEGYVISTKHVQKCWGYRFQLLYDKNTHRWRNQNGVETRIPHKFGSLKPSEYGSPDLILHGQTAYWHKLKKSFKKRDYSTDHSLKGASYDWRYSPQQHVDLSYFTHFTELVEHITADTKRKVAVLAHSMGGLMMAYYFSHQTQEWKDKHIHALITVSTPWLGSPASIVTYLKGSDFGISTMKKSIMKPVFSTFPTMALLLPYEEEYKTTVLVDWTSKNKTFTAKDYQQLFTDIGYEDGYLMRQDVRSMFPVELDKLGVRMFCIWTNKSEIKTVHKYQINGELSDADSVQPMYGEGDGSVPLTSLRYCERYKNVTVKSFQGINHNGAIQEGEVFDYVYSVLAQAEASS